jgi:hypothetical protein
MHSDSVDLAKFRQNFTPASVAADRREAKLVLSE